MTTEDPELAARVRALEAELAAERRAREEAERAAQFHQMFAAVLGHDLRNPLAAIAMGANTIARLAASERTTRAATRIVASADRMTRMIEQLLDVTRIRAAGGLVLERAPVDAAELVDKIRIELEAAYPEARILVERVGDTTGRWDRDRLLQVFSNLIGNALVHGDRACQVRLDGTDAAGPVIVTVRNQGAVPPDVLPVIFEPFRTGARTAARRGLGLGLYITQQIVGAHGGRVEAASTPEDGTTMRVELPRDLPTG